MKNHRGIIVAGDPDTPKEEHEHTLIRPSALTAGGHVFIVWCLGVALRQKDCLVKI